MSNNNSESSSELPEWGTGVIALGAGCLVAICAIIYVFYNIYAADRARKKQLLEEEKQKQRKREQRQRQLMARHNAIEAEVILEMQEIPVARVAVRESSSNGREEDDDDESSQDADEPRDAHGEFV